MHLVVGVELRESHDLLLVLARLLPCVRATTPRDLLQRKYDPMHDSGVAREYGECLAETVDGTSLQSHQARLELDIGVDQGEPSCP